MTVEDIYYIGQTIAVLAIVGSLIILIVQMRQSNKLARNAANREQSEAIVHASSVFVANPDLADLCVRADKDPHSLTEAEMLRYTTLRLSLWRTWEWLHRQHKEGMVERDLWEAHKLQLRFALAGPGAKVVWARVRPVFTQEFQVFFDELASPTGDPPSKSHDEEDPR